MAVAVAPRVADKVAFLSDPRSYPQPTGSVEAVETHMSWVFLTDRHAWKLKKPRRIDHIDLASVEARRRHCGLEIRLNRRFTDDVYLGSVALRQQPDGALTFQGEGPEVDWLVKMRRLPASLMLDRMILEGRVRARDLHHLARDLGRFYLTCAPEPMSGGEFRARLAARVRGNERELRGYAHHVNGVLAEDLGERQLAFLEREHGLFDERVAAGRVVEGHGDLRPEHVCMEAVPRVIDCLEFDRELRIVDAAEELGYLALECERLGAPGLRDLIFDAYEAAADDAPYARLVHFYQSLHACSRAWLALRHLRDPAPRDPHRWPLVARDYLRLAEEHLALCATPKL
jgi:aminoglycoside phosphotransferase family enzyme